MSKYCLYDEYQDEFNVIDEGDEEDAFFAAIPRNDLGCAPFDFYCAEHQDMLVTPERCDSSDFSTWVEEA